MQLLHSARPDASCGNELLDAGIANANESKFGGGEEGIGRDQQQDQKSQPQYEDDHGTLILTSQMNRFRSLLSCCKLVVNAAFVSLWHCAVPFYPWFSTQHFLLPFRAVIGLTAAEIPCSPQYHESTRTVGKFRNKTVSAFVFIITGWV